MMGGVFAVTSYLRIIKTMHNEIEKRGIEVSKTFSQMVTPYIFESDYVTIIDNTDELIKNSDIHEVAIFDIHGKPWLTTRQGQSIVSTSNPFYQNIIKNKTIGYRRVTEDGQKVIQLVTPIAALGEVVYLLKIDFSLKSIEQEAFARIREAMVISCIMIAVATIIGRFLAGLLIEPLNNLVQGTNEIAKGNLSHRITIESEDEIGVLSKSFNLMAGNLEKELSARKQVERDLKKHQSQLRKTVLERTAQLTQTNDRILEEIEEHKKTVVALRESEERYKRFSEVTIDGIVFHDQNGIVDINATFTELFGYSAEELKGSDLIESIRLPEKIDSRGNYFVETVGTRKDGTTLHIEILSRLLEDNSKHLSVTSIRNITDRKLLETRLRQAQKMESIGLIAGGVAHDLNNILTGIVSYPEYLLLDLPAESDLRKPLEMIRESGMKAAEVVADLLTIARGAACAKELKNLNDIINDYLCSPECLRIQQQYPEIKIDADLHPELRNMYCSAIHATKSIMNLLLNAIEAIGTEGSILISTSNEYIDTSIGETQDIKEGEYVVFSISDSGAGISDEDVPHIFEPFFSSKTMGPTSGSGLGLTVVWNTALDHDGTVLVEKNESGTTFRMYFPSTREQLAAHHEVIELESLHGKGEHLLVVDDDARQQIICSQLLKSLGYSVDTVASGEEALEYLETNTADLLILDMILGKGLNGRQTYSGIKKRIPDQKAIIVSGFSADTEVKETQNLGASGFVKKPYTIHEIGIAVKETLGT